MVVVSVSETHYYECIEGWRTKGFLCLLLPACHCGLSKAKSNELQVTKQSERSGEGGIARARERDRQTDKEQRASEIE